MVKIIELKTTQSSAIKILVDTLNSLLTDVNITFYPSMDQDGSDSESEESEEENSSENSSRKKNKKGGVVIKEVN